MTTKAHVRKLRESELLPLVRIGYLRRVPEGKQIKNADEFAQIVTAIFEDAKILIVKEVTDDK